MCTIHIINLTRYFQFYFTSNLAIVSVFTVCNCIFFLGVSVILLDTYTDSYLYGVCGCCVYFFMFHSKFI